MQTTPVCFSLSRVYVLPYSNIGSGPLYITGGVGLSDTTHYNVGVDLPASVASGGSATFTISVDPTGATEVMAKEVPAFLWTPLHGGMM